MSSTAYMLSAMTCLEDGCERPTVARRLCTRHYNYRLRNQLEMPPRVIADGPVPCTVEGCERRRVGNGYCKMHWRRAREGRPLEDPPTTPSTCTVELCGRPYSSNGYCRMHLSRWRRHGDPLVEQRSSTPLQKMQQHIQVTGFCWLWTGSIDGRGYGQLGVRVDGRRTSARAHRWVYEHLVGPIPDGLELDHLCRIRRCVNPDHLEPVTHEENVRRGWAYLPLRNRQKGTDLARDTEGGS